MGIIIGNEMNKTSDNYQAKVRLWVRNLRVARIGVVPVLPRFGSVRFNSYEAMNAWKREYLRALARQGGCQWKKS